MNILRILTETWARLQLKSGNAENLGPDTNWTTFSKFHIIITPEHLSASIFIFLYSSGGVGECICVILSQRDTVKNMRKTRGYAARIFLRENFRWKIFKTVVRE